MNAAAERAERRAALRALVFAGATPVAPPILTPASATLDVLGEAISPRLLFVRANSGESDDGLYCLRPDLTLPAALAYAAADSGSAATLCYDGPAFRLDLQSGAPEEFQQIGREVFAGPGDVAEDLGLFATAIAAAKAGGAERLRVRLSDIALLRAFLEDRSDLSPDWRARFLRRLGRPKALRDLLIAGVNSGRPGVGSADLEQAEAAFAAAAHAPLAGRQRAAIIARAAARAANDPLPSDFAQQFQQFFDLAGRPETVLATAGTIGPKGAKFMAALARCGEFWRGAVRCLESPAFAGTEISVSIQTGGAFDYYDGMVFALEAATAAGGGGESGFARIGGGGRYDRLIGLLSGGRRQAKAAGFALRPDRLAPLGSALDGTALGRSAPGAAGRGDI